MAEHGRPRLPQGRDGLHHRPREGHHHPRRPQHQPLRAGAGGRRPRRRAPRLRRGVRQPRRRHRHRAHGGARRDARRRRLAPPRSQAHDQRAGGQPDRRAGRRYRARAAGDRAQDLERQDPPHGGARVLRARAEVGEAAGGVAAVPAPGAGRCRAAIAPRPARRAGRALRPARLPGFRPVVPVRAPRRGLRQAGDHLARRQRGLPRVPARVGNPAGAARGGADSGHDRWCWP